VTLLADRGPSDTTPPSGGEPGRPSYPGGGFDRPGKRQRINSSVVVEFLGSAAASFAVVRVIFAVAGISAPFGLGVSWLAGFMVIYGVLAWRLHGVLAMKDRLTTVAVWAGALTALVPLVAVLLFVGIKGWNAVYSAFPHFFYADMSRLSLTGQSPITAVGAGASIVGTVEQVGLATIAVVPFAVLTATYLVDHHGLFARMVGAVVDAMTGAPAIIAGLFVYLLWVAPHKETGKSGFAAAMALATMMLPIVTRTAEQVIRIVPGSLREAALALGAARWRMILRVVLPTARVGLVTAVILGVARIAGETAPVLFVAGGAAKYNWNPFKGQQDDLPLRISQLAFQGSATAKSIAWGVSFVLVLVVLTLFLLARLIGSSKPGNRRFSSLKFSRRLKDEIE
jgi:phosphate transport system permease protein